MAIVQIKDVWLNNIKKHALYPKVKNIILDDDDIKELCVLPALHDYYARFPLKIKRQYNVNGTLILEYPDDETMGAVDCRIVGKLNGSAGGTSTSDFFRLVHYNQTRKKSLKTLTNSRHQYTLDESNLDAEVQDFETFKVIPHPDEYKVEIYASIPAKVMVTWGKISYNFANVKIPQRNNVIKLCASYLLSHLADSGGILEDDSIERRFNVPTLSGRSEKLYEEVFAKWDTFPIIGIFRTA